MMVAFPVADDALPSARMLKRPVLVNVSRAVGFGVATMITADVDPVLPTGTALSVTTRLMVYEAADVYVCEIVRFVPPVHAAASPTCVGTWQVVIGVPSPKFQSYFAMDCPCATVVPPASKVTESPTTGV